MNEKKILVIDDDAIIVTTLTMKLRAEGYTVVSAREISKAVNAIRCEKPDLILLDITFPPDVDLPWDGLGVMDWLHRMNDEAIPIIIITGADPAKYEARAKAAGVVALFQKPLDHAALIKVIRESLGQNTEAESSVT